MDPLDPASTLADLVTARPELAAPLDEIGLDFCCHGDRRLVDAARDAGLDLDEVVSRLASVAPRAAGDGDAWAGLDPAALVDHVEQVHHEPLPATLARLDALAEKVAGVHRARHPELAEVRRLVAALRADLEPHLAIEESTLFPLVRSGSAAEAAEALAGLGDEHDAVGALLAELRQATDRYRTPDDGCASYRLLYDGLAELEADTHLHVHKENNVLFPAVRALAASR